MERIDFTEAVLTEIGTAAEAAGMEAYVVGGYVRDILLGRATKDIDISVVGDGISFATSVARALHVRPPIVFEKFGTARLTVGGRDVEFVGTRIEEYSDTSRKPVVRIGTIEDDLRRRDFTVNALAVQLHGPSKGLIVDLYDGLADLERRILRTPLDPEATFSEDPLRMIRAFRFTAQLGFEIHASALDAIRRMAERISVVSMERIRDEFQKIIAADTPSVGLAPMQETGVMRHVFPELHALAGVDQRSVEYPDGVRNFHHKDVFYHTLRVLDNLAQMTTDPWSRWAALLHDIAKPQTKAFSPETGWTFHGHAEIGARRVSKIFRELKLPLDHVKFVEKLVALHLRPIALVDDTVTDSAIRRLLFEAGDDIDALMLLCKADITSKNPRLVERYMRNYRRLVAKMQDVEDRDRLRRWQPPLSGDEIMNLCGISSGIAVGVLKNRIEDAILEGIIPNEREAAIEYLLAIKDEILEQKDLRKSRTVRSRLPKLPDGLEPPRN